MWFRRCLVACLITGGAFVFMLWLTPPHWYREAGILDLVVVLDNSASYEAALPVARAEAIPILSCLLPGDRLAAFVVGPEVLRFHEGVVRSSGSVEAVVQQVRGLQVNTNGGTELGTVFHHVREAFEHFSVAPTPHHRRSRLLVLFSDCLPESSSDTLDSAAAMLPSRTAVMVVGWQGSDKDPVARALLGADGHNILQAGRPMPRQKRAVLPCGAYRTNILSGQALLSQPACCA